jgi:exocyst complex protein 7
MGAEVGIEALVARAEFMRESLGKSQQMTETMITILGSFDNRLSTLETAMRPTQVSPTGLHELWVSLNMCVA